MAAPMEKGKRSSASQRLERRQKWWVQHKNQVEGTDDNEPAVKKAKLEKTTKEKKSKSDKKTKSQKAPSNPWEQAILKRNEESKQQERKDKSQDSSDDSSSDHEIQDSTPNVKCDSTPDAKCDGADGETTGALCIPKKAERKPKSKREQKKYVLFIGNLSYNVTKEDLEDHFVRTGGIETIRLPTDKTTGKPRGFAYIEFKDKHSHTHALRLHHTELRGRQINVEFTSIGGNSKKRLQKLQDKNKSLERFKQFPNTPNTDQAK